MRPTPPPLADGAATTTLARARELDRLGQEGSVDLYYQAGAQAAEVLWYTAPQTNDLQVEEVYRHAVAGLIDAGQRYGRLDPRRHLIVMSGGARAIAIHHVGFAWRPDDFSRLATADRQTNREIAHHYQSAGLGVPLVGERVAACPQEIFFRPWQPFSVTAVLRPAGGDGTAPGDHVLELYNPLALAAVDFGGRPRQLASDLTAPLAAIVNEAPRQYLRGFTAPSDTAVRPQLVMVEPYQRGKIPVVFIHGLYSDPITWVDMVNELRAQPDLYRRCQFWTFRYPTGGDLLASAAVLRQRLQLARNTFDAQHTDPAMDSMVLVGHSLGGLMGKMQVAASHDFLWREVAWRPFDEVRASPELRGRMTQAFFFGPVPTVKRVIFIGTPHRGSGMTRRLAGRVGNALVQFSPEEDNEFRQLLADNPGLFKPSLGRRRPTSIMLLEPDSPFLAGLSHMPLNGAARLHSIIGTGGVNPLEPGDGVVPVTSAQHYGESELFVPARHEKLHRHPLSIEEVARILRLHAGTVP